MKMQETKMLLIVSFVAFVSGLSVAKYDQPAKGSSKWTQIVAKLKQTEQVGYFGGGNVCKICKVLATIAHAGTLSNSTSGYRDMYHFCSDLGNSGDYISEKICWTEMNVLTVAMKETHITNPVQLCTNPMVGACSSTESGVRNVFQPSPDSSINKSGCGCVSYNCGCCAHIEFDRIKVNDTVCANFSYLPAEYGISFTVTLDNRTLINKTISAKNPPPICAGLPYVKLADICLSFRNLTWTNSSLSGCVWIEAELEHVTIGEKKLGCFKMPLGEEMLVSGVMPGAENRMGEVLPKKKRNGSLYFKSLKSKTKVDRYDTASRIRDGRLGF